jgi:hypothetical protein
MGECRFRIETIDAASGKVVHVAPTSLTSCARYAPRPDDASLRAPASVTDDAEALDVSRSADEKTLAYLTSRDVRVARVGEAGARVFTVLRVEGRDVIVATDSEGHVDGSNEAIAFVRWHGAGVLESLGLAAAEKRFGTRRAPLFRLPSP